MGFASLASNRRVLKKQGIDELTIVDPWENLININAVAVDSFLEHKRTPHVQPPTPQSKSPICFESFPVQKAFPPCKANRPSQRHSKAGTTISTSPQHPMGLCKISPTEPMRESFWTLCLLCVEQLPEWKAHVASHSTTRPRNLIANGVFAAPFIGHANAVQKDLDRTILLGITAQWRSQLIRLGVESQLTHWPLAVSAVISTSRQLKPTATMGQMAISSCFLSALVLEQSSYASHSVFRWVFLFFCFQAQWRFSAPYASTATPSISPPLE